MLTQRKLIFSLALAMFATPASASPIVYAVNLSQQFGTVDLATGAFQQIGPFTPEGTGGLVPGPNGSLLTLTFSGNLNSINPATGVTSLVGPTGLGDCSSPSSTCGPNSANAFGKFGTSFYATDFSNNLYTVNPANAAATLIGPTGIPAFTFNPNIPNPDGTLNILDESLFSAGGKLYATFDTATLDLETSVSTAMIPAKLYQINPLTGLATSIAPTALNLSAVVEVNGTIYAFHANTLPNQVVTLNLANGTISNPVSELYPDPGQLVLGASPVPEPASIALASVGIAALLVVRWLRLQGRKV